MRKYLPYIILTILMILISISLSISEKRIEIARDFAKNYSEACIKRVGPAITIQKQERQNYCLCMRDYYENINAPHPMFDRITFGYFWNKKDALEKHSSQLARCKSGAHTL